jgi:lysosomal acid lipase/cholesteryl ester hydrolase
VNHVGGRRGWNIGRGAVRAWLAPVLLAMLATSPGCATMRRHASNPDLRPCSDGFAYTADGWRLGVRHLRPAHPDPEKLPVVLCHGLGLNGTFWTITDPRSTLPTQLLARGYEVFIFDFRGSGDSARIGAVGNLNAYLRETFLLELGEGRWNVDEIALYDVPAILDYVKTATGRDRVNWVGHSLGGMLMFAYLEVSAQPWRVANLVAMGATISFANAPKTDLLVANRGLRALSRLASPGRLGRPLMIARFPGLDRIDQFYFSSVNVDRSTIARFYGYTLEDTGRGALAQLDPYIEFGHFVSADRKIDYADRLPEVITPTLMIAGDGDVMSDVPSTSLTFSALGSADKTMFRFGKAEGHIADYGHCDLVWSRYAPSEIFPPLIDWLDARQLRPFPSRQSPEPQTKDAAIRPGGAWPGGGMLSNQRPDSLSSDPSRQRLPTGGDKHRETNNSTRSNHQAHFPRIPDAAFGDFFENASPGRKMRA